MQYNEFMAAIRQKKPQRIYLLTGEEPYFIEKAEKRLCEMLLTDEAAKDSLFVPEPGISACELAGVLSSAPFFTEQNVVLARDMLFWQKAEAKDIGSLEAVLSEMPDFSTVIFVLHGKLDKRRRLYKTIAAHGLVLETVAVRAWNINTWLQPRLREMGRRLSPDAQEYFCSAAGLMQQISLGYLDQELEKLALYTEAAIIGKDDLQAVFSGVPEISGFAMLDAVSGHDLRQALLLLHRQVKDGVYLPVLVGMLVRHVRQLWQAKVLLAGGTPSKGLGRAMELNPFIAEKLGRASKGFSPESLKAAVLSLADADYALKTGRGGEGLLEAVLIGLCGQAQK